MIALANSNRPESLTLTQLSKLIAYRLNKLDIHGDCHLYWIDGWLRFGWVPLEWDEYAISCSIPCDVLEEEIHGLFVGMVTNFVEFHGGNENDSPQ